MKDTFIRCFLHNLYWCTMIACIMIGHELGRAFQLRGGR